MRFRALTLSKKHHESSVFCRFLLVIVFPYTHLTLSGCLGVADAVCWWYDLMVLGDGVRVGSLVVGLGL